MLVTGKSVPEVALENGYSKHTFYRVINGETNSPKVQAIIASLINKGTNEIWKEDQPTIFAEARQEQERKEQRRSPAPLT